MSVQKKSDRPINIFGDPLTKPLATTCLMGLLLHTREELWDILYKFASIRAAVNILGTLEFPGKLRIMFNVEVKKVHYRNYTLFLSQDVNPHVYLSKHFGGTLMTWKSDSYKIKNIKTIFHWEVSAAGAIIQHMADSRLLKMCFSGVSDISTTISLIDVVKYAPKSLNWNFLP